MAFPPGRWPAITTAISLAWAWVAASGRGVDGGDMLMMDRFLRWQATHNRSYPSAGERLRRFQVYHDNVDYVDATNRRGNLTYRLGENQFADLTRKEFLAKFMSYDGNDRTEDDNTVITTAQGADANMWSSGGVNVSLDPASVDWRAKGAVVPPKTQTSSCFSSWAFTAVATIESLHSIKTGKLVPLSEQQLVDCDQYNGGCNRGSFRRAFHWVHQNGGLSTEAEYPYKAAQGTCDTAKSDHHVAAITGHASVPASNELAIAKQPVAAAIELGSDIQFYKSGVYSGPCGTRLQHVVTVVGYDADESTGEKFWIVKNSSGQTWGERGYISMQRRILGPGLCGIMLDVAYPTMS
uniref:Fruit bromelain n=1 Tax=Aegilops tauschii subsp. strangulata TaxID=200361 RepID=A0A453AEM1_AEGTS